MVRGYFKRNGILVVTAAVYLAAVLGIALSIDVLIYQKEKRNLFVRYIPEDIFLDVIGPLMDLVDQWQNDLQAGKDDREILGKIEAAAHEIVQGPSSIYHIAIKRADGTVLFDEETDKFAAFNDFSNSLWLRRFTNQRIRQVASSDPSGGRATVWVYFTTPRIDSQVFAAEVEKLKAGGATHEAVDALRAKNEKLLNLPKEIADLTQTYRQLTFYLVAALTVLTAIFVNPPPFDAVGAFV
ncbi:hypothetical protein HY256_07605 [Candidatus Sumerlaeota bacterium]|nr:hypothetical protein [Candidatus Sumerlaeota bacterium]